MVVRFQCAWPSLRTIAISHARFQHSISAPVAADSAAGREGWRSQTEGEIFKGTDGACADPGTQNFPCHGGGAAGGQGHSQFNSINFYVTNRFFVSFLTQERNVTPSSPRSCPLSCSSGSAPRSGAKGCAFPAGRCSFAISPARRQPPFASSPARRPDQSEAA